MTTSFEVGQVIRRAPNTWRWKKASTMYLGIALSPGTTRTSPGGGVGLDALRSRSHKVPPLRVVNPHGGVPVRDADARLPPHGRQEDVRPRQPGQDDAWRPRRPAGQKEMPYRHAFPHPPGPSRALWRQAPPRPPGPPGIPRDPSSAAAAPARRPPPLGVARQRQDRGSPPPAHRRPGGRSGGRG